MKQINNLVITCGISFFGRNNLYGKRTDEKKLLHFEGTNPVPHPDFDAERWKKEMATISQQERLRLPKKISAEYSALFALQKMGRLDGSPFVTLVHTDSFGARLAVEVLKTIIKEDFEACVEVIETKDFNVEHPQLLKNGISIYLKNLLGILRGNDPAFTAFAPIGGYKVMMAYGSLLANLLNFPTLYLHEDAQVLHVIPAIPFQIDRDIIVENAQFLRKINNLEVLESGSMSEDEMRFVEAFPFMFEKADDLVSISPFGRFLIESPDYLQHVGVQYRGSAQVRDLINGLKGRQRKMVIDQMKILASKLLSWDGKYDGNLMHETDFTTLKKQKPAFNLYKGKSSWGDGVFRCAWRFDRENLLLDVNYLWIDHDLYEKEVKEGKGLFENRVKYDLTSLIYGE
ncbi:hypothetical protein [Caldithrix abyssi]